MGEVVIAVTGEGVARWYGLGEKGVGHVVMTGQDCHGDPLVFAATLYKGCAGKELDAARLVEKFDGDAKCKRCAAWLDSATGVSELDAARLSYWKWENGSDALADAMGAHTLITLDGVTQVDAPGVREDSTPDAAMADPATKRAAAVERDRKRMADVRAKRAASKGKAAQESRENSAPVRTRDDVRSAVEAARTAPAPVTVLDPSADIVASTGKTLAQMAEEVAVHYANGKSVPTEIATLPDPSAPRVWDVVESGTESSVLVCEFHGPVTKINMERTHGKCPGCSTYIPLLPEAESKGDAKPKSSGVKCPKVGEVPVAGSRVAREDHSVSLPDDYSGPHSGKCQGCDRIIAVSREGGMRNHHGVIAPEIAEGESVDKIGKHNVGGVATPATKGRLKDKAIELVEHGSVPGDPGDANTRRAEESRCPKSRKTLKGRETPGKVDCPNEECGRIVELKARPTKDGVSYFIPDHTLRGRVVVAETGKLDPSARVFRTDGRNVTPFGTGADAGKGQRDHGSVDGSAIISQTNMAPVQPGGWLGHAGTGQLPAGLQSGIDPTVAGEWCPICKDLKEIAHRGKSRGWRRGHSKAVGALLREREAKREAVKVAQIRNGEAIPSRIKKELRKAAAVGSFSEGVNAHSGTVTHAARPLGRLGSGAYSSAK